MISLVLSGTGSTSQRQIRSLSLPGNFFGPMRRTYPLFIFSASLYLHPFVYNDLYDQLFYSIVSKKLLHSSPTKVRERGVEVGGRRKRKGKNFFLKRGWQKGKRCGRIVKLSGEAPLRGMEEGKKGAGIVKWSLKIEQRDKEESRQFLKEHTKVRKSERTRKKQRETRVWLWHAKSMW